MKTLLLTLVPVVAVMGATLAGVCEITWGPRAFQSLAWVKLLLVAVLHGGFVAFFVLGPLANIIYPKLDKKSEFTRMGIACLYTLVPLFSYAYYLSTEQDFVALVELFVAIVPIVVAGLILFEADRSFKNLALFVAVGTFIPFYLFNDILGPFDVAVQFVPKTPVVALVRAFACWICVFVATWWAEPQSPEAKARFHASGCLEIFGFAFFVHLIAPLIAAATKANFPLNPIQDAWWVSYLFLSYFLARHLKRAYWVMVSLSFGLGLFALVRFILCFTSTPEGIWTVLGVQYYAVSAFVLLRIGLFLVREEGKSLFSGSLLRSMA